VRLDPFPAPRKRVDRRQGLRQYRENSQDLTQSWLFTLVFSLFFRQNNKKYFIYKFYF
jgi:hypothetical protein